MSLDRLDDLAMKVNTLWMTTTQLQERYARLHEIAPDLTKEIGGHLDLIVSTANLSRDIALDVFELQIKVDKLTYALSGMQEEASLKWTLKRKLRDWGSSVLRQYFYWPGVKPTK